MQVLFRGGASPTSPSVLQPSPARNPGNIFTTLKAIGQNVGILGGQQDIKTLNKNADLYFQRAKEAEEALPPKDLTEFEQAVHYRGNLGGEKMQEVVQYFQEAKTTLKKLSSEEDFEALARAVQWGKLLQQMGKNLNDAAGVNNKISSENIEAAKNLRKKAIRQNHAAPIKQSPGLKKFVSSFGMLNHLAETTQLQGDRSGTELQVYAKQALRDLGTIAVNRLKELGRYDVQGQPLQRRQSVSEMEKMFMDLLV